MFPEKTKKTHTYSFTGIYALYTLLFGLLSLGVFFWYIESGRTLIWELDSWQQHYKALIYYSQYIRKIIYGIAEGHRLVIPQWDMSIGEGADILQVFNYYGIGDPFNFLAFLVPARSMYIYYQAAVVLRMYLCGIAFIRMFAAFAEPADLCRNTGADAALPDIHHRQTAGAGLCPNTVGAATLQDSGHRPGAHTACPDTAGAAALLTGALMYAFCFWNIYSAASHPFFIDPAIYFPLIIGGIENIFRGRKARMLTAAVFFQAISNFYFFYIIVIITVLYAALKLVCAYGLKVKKYIAPIRNMFLYSFTGVLLAAAVLLPVIAAYLSDPRISGSTAFTFIYPDTDEYLSIIKSFFIPGVDDYWICGGFGPVGVVCLGYAAIKKENRLIRSLFAACLALLFVPFFGQVLNAFNYITHRWVWAIALLVSYCIAVYLPELFSRIKARRLHNTAVICCGILAGITIIFNSFKNNSPEGLNYPADCVPADEINARLDSCDAILLRAYTDGADDREYFRYETGYSDFNNGILFGLSTPQYYWTLQNPYVKKFGLAFLSNYPVPNVVSGYDSRITLDSLSCVKYYIFQHNEDILPFGAEYLTSNGFSDLYLNPNALDLTYSYDSYIDSSVWDSADVCEREALMLKGAVLDENALNVAGLRQISPDTDCVTVAKFGKNELVMQNADAIDIPIEGVENSETIFVIKGLRYTGTHKSARILLKADDGARNQILYNTPEKQYYHGIEDFAANLGYNEKPLKSIELRFLNTGTYTYDSIEIICHRLDSFKADTERLKGSGLSDLKLDTDRITGSIENDDTRLLCIAVPYSSGWKAYVDGTEADIINTNIKYMGIMLAPGKHEVELRYCNPYRLPGLIISLLTAAALLAMIPLKAIKCKTAHCNASKSRGGSAHGNDRR